MPDIVREYLIIDFKYSGIGAGGGPLRTKRGDPMWRVDLQIEERPGIWINGLVFREPENWKGTKKSLILFKDTYRGEEVPKFKLPPTPKAASVNLQLEKLTEIAELLKSIDGRLAELLAAQTRDGT